MPFLFVQLLIISRYFRQHFVTVLILSTAQCIQTQRCIIIVVVLLLLVVIDIYFLGSSVLRVE